MAMDETGPETAYVPAGYIVAVHGVRGWLKVFSHTDPPENITAYAAWYLGTQYQPMRVLESRCSGKSILVKLASAPDGVIESRDTAAAMVGEEVSIARGDMPRTEPGEYYWADLIGLEVATTGGRKLGTVERLFPTAANDVLVVHGERERLIPFLSGRTIHEVDRIRGRITVDWDADF